MLKRKLSIILLILCLFLGLTSCDNKTNATLRGYIGEKETGRLFIGCHIWFHQNYDKPYPISLNYARSENRSFEEAYSIYYYTNDSFGRIMDCETDFGTNEKYHIKGEQPVSLKDNDTIMFGFVTDYIPYELNSDVFFTKSMDTIILFLAPKDAILTEKSQIDEYASVSFDYKIEDNYIKIKYDQDYI